MGAHEKGVQFAAGIVDTDENLTELAINLFIEDVKSELNGINSSFFKCGEDLKLFEFADLLNLEDRIVFKDFYDQIVFGQFGACAKALNLEGGYMFLPICDPFALAFSLGVDFDANFKLEDFIQFLIPNLPLLAIKLNITPPIKLASKFPNLLTLPDIPKLEIPKPNLPSIQIPDLLLDLQFIDKLPSLILEIIAKLPSLILKLINPPDFFVAICKIIHDAKIFGTTDSRAILKIAAEKVLVRKITEMILLLCIGKTLGNSSDGLVGTTAKEFRYIPPQMNRQPKQQDIRSKIVDYGNLCIDLKWGDTKNKDKDGFTVQQQYAQKILYTEYGDGKAHNLNKNDPLYDPRVLGEKGAIAKLADSSSCGLFARACLFAGGASYVPKYFGQPLLNKNLKIDRYYDFFYDEYRIVNKNGIAIECIWKGAKDKNAIYPKTKNDLPPVLRGDVIIIYDPKIPNREHVLVVQEDYEAGSLILKTIEGGQSDRFNNNKPTAILAKSYIDGNSDEFKNKTSTLDPPHSIRFDKSGNPLIGGRSILAAIDSEAFCKSSVGTNARKPSTTISGTLTDSNDPQSDFDNGYLED